MEVHPIKILGKDTTFEARLDGKEKTVLTKCIFILCLAKTGYLMYSDKCFCIKPETLP
jgi:hypothetical protein